MTDVPLQPEALVRYDTTSHHDAVFDRPAYRFNWRAVHGSVLAGEFKFALKRLEGLLYAVWGGQPLYAEGKQWYAREHPRCRWGPEQWWQQPRDLGGWFWNYLETAALGELYAGEAPSVPVRSRSGDPEAQFKRADHSIYFPFGSVQRYCGAPGSTGHQAHDPASTFKQFSAWPDAEDVVIRYTRPAELAESATWLKVMTAYGMFDMVEVAPDIWETTFPARPQDTWIDWYLLGVFSASPDARFDPFVGINEYGAEIEPKRRGPVADPEHDRPADAAYSFRFFSHYNPYAHGLPELLDETPPHLQGNWLRRGTDEHRFDSSESIDPRLINLARFVLDYIGRQFHHNPRNRGEPESCCVPMPIEWRWSGSHVPDLYRSGGKGGAVGTQPLHNNPHELNAGSEDARKSWRGIEMAWRDAGSVPGLFPDNWWYGNDESWLAWPDQLVLDSDPQNPPFEAIVRDYRDRGLQPGDAIDPVHLREIIDAVDYLCDQGLWTTTSVATAKMTIAEAWGSPCGVGEWGVHEDGPAGSCNENWDDTYGPFGCDDLCCYSCPGGECVPYARPSWAECWEGAGGPGWAPGRCLQTRWQYRLCEYWPDFASGQDCGRYEYDFFVDCNVEPPSVPAGAERGATIERDCKLAETWDSQEQECTWLNTRCINQTTTYGSAYYLCGPPRCLGGPDASHGNGLGKSRRDQDLNLAATGPSMGNCFSSVESCAQLVPGEPDAPGFETVVGVVSEGVGNPWWDDQFECEPGTMQEFDYAAAIAGLGIYNYAGTDTLSHFANEDFYSVFPDCRYAPEGVMRRHWLEGTVGVGQWPVCLGDHVWVSIDLNKDVAGVPQLRNYDLTIEDPFDDCPCRTWTAPGSCV